MSHFLFPPIYSMTLPLAFNELSLAPWITMLMISTQLSLNNCQVPQVCTVPPWQFQSQPLLFLITNYSTDLVQENDPNDPFDSMRTSDFLPLLTHPSVPPHELYLKVGAVSMIMQNMSLEKGLIKNTREVIDALHEHSVPSIIMVLWVPPPSPSLTYTSASTLPPQVGQWTTSNSHSASPMLPLSTAVLVSLSTEQSLTWKLKCLPMGSSALPYQGSVPKKMV